MIARSLVSDEEVQRHIRWQVSMGEDGGNTLWATLPAAFTPTFEMLNEDLASGFVHCPSHPQFVYAVFPTAWQFNVQTGERRHMQRVVVLRVGLGR